MLLLAAAWLAGCETSPTVDVVDDPERVWMERQARLAGVESWTATGKLGVQSAADSWSATITWRQSRDTFGIRLAGPLGQGSMELTGEPGLVELRARGEIYRARTAEELMQRHAGWRVPLSGLRYWILGRTDPEALVTGYRLDDAGRLTELEQLGWRVSYERYAEFDGLLLPTKMTLENPRLKAKLVLRSWQTEPAST